MKITTKKTNIKIYNKLSFEELKKMGQEMYEKHASRGQYLFDKNGNIHSPETLSQELIERFSGEDFIE